MHDFLKILGISFRAAGGLAILVFIVAFFGPLLIGGPGAHQGPLGAFIYAPAAFFLVFFVALLIQFRRALRLSTGWKFAYFVLLLLSLIPAARIVGFISEIDFVKSVRNIDLKSYSKSERLKHIPPLTDDEGRLLKSTHFNMRVVVVNPRMPVAYTRSLIDDLKKTDLFDEVAEFGQMGKADLIATLTGGYYGDKGGQSFTLKPPDGPGKEVPIKIYYTLGGVLSGGEEKKQYLDRLSVTLINVVPQVINRNQHQGSWRDGVYTGHGTFVWANGNRYDGEFVNGKRTGQGTFVWAKTGARYEGDFANGKRTGQGTLIWSSGTRYEGDFVNGKRTGQGTLIWRNGARYEGRWLNGKPHGFGTKKNANGKTFTGNWTNGCFRQGDTYTTIGISAAKCGFE